ncbi:CopG family transcriptional regulator [Euzebya tangerina]|uniref:ribbon-helix-helix domain-containing protein n=1 Tax=Euzebya tangerina TaxID=591198 RepID=UPI000E321C9B|nr:CopG family transcriptional regulator [Euzebya tangerina]
MIKTTVYLPDELKRQLALVADLEGRSEAEVIRVAISNHVSRPRRRPPTLPLVNEPLGDPDAARRVDDLLEEGFGR